MGLYDQPAPIQCPLCTGPTEVVRRRRSTTLHHCPKCSLELDHLDPSRRVEPLDATNLRRKPATESPPGPTHPTTPRTGKQDPAVCRYCGSSKLFELSLDAGPHHSETRCADCQLHLKFNPRPWTLERALRFELPFGKYRGSKVGELAKTGRGRSYLKWMAENLSGNPATAARIALANDPFQPQGISDRRSAERRRT
jgi:transcription elongation factor Elf1